MSDILTQLTSSPMLRQYAQGLVEQMVGPAADFLAPTVEVNTNRARFKKYTAGEAFTIPDTRRALGGQAAVISFKSTDGTVDCEPHALDFPADQLEQIESAEMGMNLLEEGAGIAAQIAALAHEVRVIDAALTSVGAGTSLNVASTDPINAIDEQIKAVALACGGFGSLMNIRVLVGIGAKLLLKNSSFVRARFTTAAKAGSMVIPNLTDEQLSALLLMNPEVMTATTVTNSANPGLTASLAFKLDTSILIFAAARNPTRMDPSFMKTFRLAGQWMTPRVYSSPDGRVDYRGWDWTSDVQVVNSAACYRFNLSSTPP